MYENSFSFKKCLTAFSKPLLFSARSTRTELLGYVIASNILSISIAPLAILMTRDFAQHDFFASINIVNLLTYIPFPALAIRRLHDQNRTGAWFALMLVPSLIVWAAPSLIDDHSIIHFVAAVVSIVGFVLLFFPPSAGANRFGSDPRFDGGLTDPAH